MSHNLNNLESSLSRSYRTCPVWTTRGQRLVFQSPESQEFRRYNDMLRKTTNGVNTSKVVSSSQTSAKAIWVPKHLLTNSKGPNKSWVPKCA